MRPSVLSLSLAAIVGSSAAHAGNSRIKVTIDKPVAMIVDGQRFEPNESMTYVADGLGHGTHEVSFRNIIGRELANVLLEVPEDSEVRCRYRRRVLDCFETVALGATPLIEPTVVVADPEPAVVYVPESEPQVVETTTTTTVTTTTDGLPPGFGGSIAMTGPDGEHLAVGIDLGGFADASVTETTTTVTTHERVEAPPVHVPPPVRAAPVAAPPRRPAPTNVALVLRSTDGEWADVVVDGKVVAEFRNDDEIQVTISSGTHTLEVREYMEDSAYTRARIHTRGKDAIIIGLAEGRPIECYNHNGCETSF